MRPAEDKTISLARPGPSERRRRFRLPRSSLPATGSNTTPEPSQPAAPRCSVWEPTARPAAGPPRSGRARRAHRPTPWPPSLRPPPRTRSDCFARSRRRRRRRQRTSGACANREDGGRRRRRQQQGLLLVGLVRRGPGVFVGSKVPVGDQHHGIHSGLVVLVYREQETPQYDRLPLDEVAPEIYISPPFESFLSCQ